jgi:hypothetical protein
MFAFCQVTAKQDEEIVVVVQTKPTNHEGEERSYVSPFIGGIKFYYEISMSFILLLFYQV